MFDFISDVFDSVSDTANNIKDSISHNGVVQYAQTVYAEKKSDAEQAIISKIDKATTIVEKSADDPYILLKTAALASASISLVPSPASLATTPALSKHLDEVSKRVRPKPGSIVYCNLAGPTEHSGVYIGDNQIVHLNRYGNIEIVSPQEFIKGTPAFSIYVSCRDNEAVGGQDVAENAKRLVGSTRNYNVVFDNCHQFSASCLLGESENRHTILTMLKLAAYNKLDAKQWLHWDRRYW